MFLASTRRNTKGSDEKLTFKTPAFESFHSVKTKCKFILV